MPRVRRNVLDIPLEYFQEAFAYDPVTGRLTWRFRPREHFDSDRKWKANNGRWVGKIVGQISNGYRTLNLKYRGVTYLLLTHHICWLLAGRELDPTKTIDHINGVRDDNRLDNLRQVTQQQNCMNRGLSCRSTTGVTGVTRSRGKFMAHIQIDGRTINLGRYATVEEATRVRRNAELYYFGEFSRNGNSSAVPPKPRCPNCSSLTSL